MSLFQLTWFYNHHEIHEVEDKYSIIYTKSWGTELTISNISESDAGTYTCKTMNEMYSTSFDMRPKGKFWMMMVTIIIIIIIIIII